MKLQVSQPESTPHLLDLPGPEVVVGRDPTCDLVLNDERCSRRHAVLAEDPEGLEIRDTGSSNGIWVNGRQLRRSRLRPGDTVRIGDTVIRILPDSARTRPVANERRPGVGLDARGVATARPTPRRAPGRAADRAPIPTITTLAALWALSSPIFLIGSLVIAVRTDTGVGVAVLMVAAGLLLAVFAGLMAVGLRARAPWARQLQIVSAGAGLLVCPFAFASVAVLIYMLRDDVKAAFGGDPAGTETGSGDAELTFALSLLGMVVLGLGLTAGLFLAFSAP
jgi:predicted lysophospholipase L1 biosynthesis ABC-type transport system permease subunit